MTISLLDIPKRIAKVRRMDMFSSGSLNPGVFSILSILAKEVLVSCIEWKGGWLPLMNVEICLTW